MKSLKAYAIAAHFGPTMLITAISFLLAARLWWEGPAYLIAFNVKDKVSEMDLGTKIKSAGLKTYEVVKDTGTKVVNKGTEAAVNS